MNLPKTYEPTKYEADIYELWQQSGTFKPQGSGTPYSIIMPPPNANGNLHIGHALGNALQDTLIRFHRMNGKRAVYLSGADHAGFETWVVYEKKLEKEGSSRFNFSRDELYQQTWDFVAQNRGDMEQQLRALGASCDWSTQTFTLDPNVVAVAYRTFEKMWNDGLIYRGERIVNYCTKHQTSFADIEVIYREEKSKLWTIKFPLKDSSEVIEIATTRPETMLGDVAVAVNPNDERYSKLIGKQIALPLTDRTIPIIADEMVDMKFGTGAVKITPAHDPNDFEVVERHPGLPRMNIIDFDGLINQNAPKKYRGLSVQEARNAVLTDLSKLNLLVKEQEHANSVGRCYKCDTIIQPLLKDQWFISVKTLAERAIRVIEKKEIIFTPENKGRVLINYLKNLKDWNISRQIPWGIPIPAFQNTSDEADWIFDTRVDQEQIELNGKTYKRDPDTFDTWFSSSQWPFITTLFSQTEALDEFYPTEVLETGGDILFPWVSRMIMMGLYVTDRIPFKNVYLHGLVLDPKGQKMSKSKGNVLNPRDAIREYGSDALRIGLMSARSAGQDQAFSIDKVVAGRNFCNKLWNIARFIESTLGDKVTEAGEPKPQTAADHWIIRELVAAKQSIASLLHQYRFAEATELVYHTIWDKVADWYIEASKTAHSVDTMLWVLEASLIMTHPFAPFVTETIWQTLDWHAPDEDMLITTQWQLGEEYDEAKAQQFEQLQNIITESRGVLVTIGKSDVALVTTDSKVVLENEAYLQRILNIGYVKQVDEGAGLRLTTTNEHAWLSLDEDQLELYRNSISDKLKSVESKLRTLQNRLANENYIKSAPEILVAETRLQLKSFVHQQSQLKLLLENI